MEHKVAYPAEAKQVVDYIIETPRSLSELQNWIPNANIILDELMKFGIVNRILVPIDGIDYIYLEVVKPDATFTQGRRDFIRR